jgi:hypothetical protein
MTHTEYRVWEIDGCICYECNRKPEPRKFSWMMRVRNSTLKAQIVKSGDMPLAPVVNGMSALGMEFIRDQPAAYDDGRTFIVLEKTKGLEWAVMDTRDTSTMKDKLGFEDAVMWCNLFNDSEDNQK